MTNDEENPPEAKTSRPVLAGLDLRQLMAEGFVPGGLETDENALPELEGYEVLRRLGRGGMGSVFLARQISLDRLVAVKMIAGRQVVARSFLDRLEREAKTMARLNHPNLVQVFDFVRLDHDDAAIVMEWIPGGNLRDARMTGGEPLPLGETRAIVHSILSALEAAHEAGIVHRDIKPENILVTAENAVKVSDFGIALPTGDGERFTATGTYSGTPGYAAPEQVAGEHPDARSDLYAVGVLLYELLIGTRPAGSFDPPHKINSKIPDRIGNAVMACLRPNPEDRPESAADLRRMLSKKKTGTRRKVISASLATAVVTGVAGTGFLWSRRLPEVERHVAEVLNETAPEELDPRAGRILRGHVDVSRGTYETNEEITIYSIIPGRPMIGSDLKISFTRLAGEYSIAVFLRLPMGVCSNELSAWSRDLGGVQMIDGIDLRYNPNAFRMRIETGRRYEWETKIREDRITTFLDGELMQEQEIVGRQLSPTDPWKWNQLNADGVDLAIGTYLSATIFHSIQMATA